MKGHATARAAAKPGLVPFTTSQVPERGWISCRWPVSGGGGRLLPERGDKMARWQSAWDTGTHSVGWAVVPPPCAVPIHSDARRWASADGRHFGRICPPCFWKPSRFLLRGGLARNCGARLHGEHTWKYEQAWAARYALVSPRRGPLRSRRETIQSKKISTDASKWLFLGMAAGSASNRNEKRNEMRRIFFAQTKRNNWERNEKRNERNGAVVERSPARVSHRAALATEWPAKSSTAASSSLRQMTP